MRSLLSSQRTFLAVLAAMLVPTPAAEAGGPLATDTDGQGVAWDTSEAVTYETDLGGLGLLSPAEATALAEDFFDVWNAVPSATVQFERVGSLDVDVDSSNFGPFLGPYGGGDEPLGRNVIVFDEDGSIFGALFGVGTGIVGFAGPTFFSDGQSTVPIGAPLPSGSRIIEGLAFLNGRFIDGVDDFPTGNGEISAELFEAAFVHEFGHFAGLDHTQIHGLAAPPGFPFPGITFPVETMFPFLVSDDMRTLGRDDVVALSSLYPTADFTATTGCVEGRILDAGGEPFSGANVVADNVLLGADAISSVSGSDPEQPGSYRICGLSDGATYTVRIEEIDAWHAAGSSVGPFSPPRVVPAPPEYYSGDFESADPAVDSPQEAEIVTAVAGTTAAGIDVVLNRQFFEVENVVIDELWGPRSFAVADFDQDGFVDFAAPSEGRTGGNDLTFYRGRGDTTFEPPERIELFPGVFQAVAGQLNPEQDSFPDVAAESFTRNEIRLYSGGPGGLSLSAILVPLTDPDFGTTHLGLGNFNQDAYSDLIYVVQPPPYEEVFLNLFLGDGFGGFTQQQAVLSASLDLSIPSGPHLQVGAFDDTPGDDIVFIGKNGTFIGDEPFFLLLRNDGDGNFEPVTVPVENRIRFSSAAGDFNGDGIADLAFESIPGDVFNQTTLQLLLGDGDGGFTPGASHLVPEVFVESIVTADFDRDGHLDAASTGAPGGPGRPGAKVTLGFGDGMGGFRETTSVWGLAEFPAAMAAADLDADGGPELLVSDASASLGRPPQLEPQYSVLSRDVEPVVCGGDGLSLCLAADRFRVEVSWRDFEDGTGVGTPVPLTGDTGYFWFFGPDNVELMVKVLDGRSINGHFWVFFGSLTNVEFTLTVTDSVTGASRTYFNPAEQFASVGDTTAFALGQASKPMPAAFRALPERAGGAQEKGGACMPGPARLCLDERFALEVEWQDFEGLTGTGTAVPLTTDTGAFWFFDEANLELVVKVLDGRSINGHFWVFFGALTNVEYTMTVTDTVTGASRTYVNPAERFASAGDVLALPGG